jgi:hypothetical protein
MMISKQVDESKKNLGHQFRPKLESAIQKISAMEQTLENEIKTRDN